MKGEKERARFELFLSVRKLRFDIPRHRSWNRKKSSDTKFNSSQCSVRYPARADNRLEGKEEKVGGGEGRAGREDERRNK